MRFEKFEEFILLVQDSDNSAWKAQVVMARGHGNHPSYIVRHAGEPLSARKAISSAQEMQSESGMDLAVCIGEHWIYAELDISISDTIIERANQVFSGEELIPTELAKGLVELVRGAAPGREFENEVYITEPNLATYEAIKADEAGSAAVPSW